MKKILLVSGIVLMGGLVAFAQKQTKVQPKDRSISKIERNITPAQIAEKKTQRLDREVQLNSDQKEKIKEIYLRQAERNHERVTIRRNDQKEIEGILHDDQKEKYNELKRNRMDEMQNRKLQRKEIKVPANK